MSLAAMPAHVAIIMDGNGRWAKSRFLPRSMGHRQGAQSLKVAIQAAREWGIRYLSVYVFSTENWSRSQDEVTFLMGFLTDMLVSQTPELIENDVRVCVMGNRVVLSEDLQRQIASSESASAHCQSLQLNLLINYGGRDEIVQAVQQLIAQGVSASEVTESRVAAHLYTKDIPDPDMVIRTGGDIRTSNFLLWQSAYAEYFFIPTLWPDFNRAAFESVLTTYRSRERRFGGVHA